MRHVRLIRVLGVLFVMAVTLTLAVATAGPSAAASVLPRALPTDAPGAALPTDGPRVALPRALPTDGPRVALPRALPTDAPGR